MSLSTMRDHGGHGGGKIVRHNGLNEEEYESWRFGAKAHLRTKTKKDDAGIISNEEELAAELATIAVYRDGSAPPDNCLLANRVQAPSRHINATAPSLCGSG